MRTRTLQQFLELFSTETLSKLCDLEKLQFEGPKPAKRTYVEQLTLLIEDRGIKEVIKWLSASQLTDLYAAFMGPDVPKASKNAQQKRIQEKLMEYGIEEFCNKWMTSQLLVHFIHACGETIDKQYEKEALLPQVSRLICEIGLTSYLSHHDSKFLKTCLDDLQLDIGNKAATRKMVEAIITLNGVFLGLVVCLSLLLTQEVVPKRQR
jgi:hypothetical protein